MCPKGKKVILNILGWYVAIAYMFIFLVTLVRIIHFFRKFRLEWPKGYAKATILFFAPPIILSAVTFPIELCNIYKNKRIVDIRYAYDIICCVYELDFMSVQAAGIVRHHEL